MKTRIQNLFLVLVCLIMLPMLAAAQAFTNLYTFTNSTTSNNYNYINSDGAIPNGGLVLLGNTLYGTTMYVGGTFNFTDTHATNTSRYYRVVQQ